MKKTEIEIENEIWEKIVDLTNLYYVLSPQHPTDDNEWNFAIHELQKLMGLRILKREHPEIFYKKNKNKKE